MITVASVLEDIILRTPFMEELVSKRLINLSAIARLYRKEIEEKTLKPVKTGAIIMALKRLGEQKNQKLTGKNLIKIKEVVVRSNLFEITVKNTDNGQLINKIYSLKTNNNFLTATEGVFETTIVASRELKKVILTITKQLNAVSMINDLSSITLRLEEDNIKTPGVYYQILKKLYWNNINIIEVISTTNEISIVIGQKDLENAFYILGKN